MQITEDRLLIHASQKKSLEQTHQKEQNWSAHLSKVSQ